MQKKQKKTGEKTENKAAEKVSAKDVRKSGIEDTIKAIKTKFGEDAIMKLGEKPRVDVNAISTGSIGLG